MIKLIQILTWLMVTISTFSYAQLPAPAYVGSAKFSAKGSGSNGIPTINFTIPNGTTNKNRMMIISMTGERYNPGGGSNFFCNKITPASDYSNALDLPDVYVNGVMSEVENGYHINALSSVPTELQNWSGAMWSYKMPDNLSGTIPITFQYLPDPMSANDEISFIISVYENVKSSQYINGYNYYGSTYSTTSLLPTLGRTVQETMYIVNGGITYDTDLTLSTGWQLEQLNRVNNPGTGTAYAANENDGVAHIVAHQNNIVNPSAKIDIAGGLSYFSGGYVFHGLLPLASPSVAGQVVTPALNSVTGTQGGGLWMNVINKADNTIVTIIAVNATGDFSVPPGILLEGENYDFVLSKNAGIINTNNPVTVALNSGWGYVAEGLNNTSSDGVPNGIFNFTVGDTNVSGLRFAIKACNASYTPSVHDITNTCPSNTVDLNTAHTNIAPAGTSLVWFTNNTHTGAALSGTQVTQAVAGTYYAFYYDNANLCWSPASNPVTVTINSCFVCPPDPYAAQQTWWLPFQGNKVRIDFQSGSAVLNNPGTGFLGQGVTNDGIEGNATVTHPITGELLFVTDGNRVYKGSTGTVASGLVGGNASAGEAAAVIPDPQGQLGRDFIIFGNSSSGSAGTLISANYNLETNSLSNIATLFPASFIYEALEVIPHTNGEDYWILVNTSDQNVKSYLYSKTTGFNSTPVSSTAVTNLSTVPSSHIAYASFISWDPRNPGTVLIAKHNKVGLASFNSSTGTLGVWNVKVTVNTGDNAVDYTTGYSTALSPNGRYIYYRNNNAIMYYDNNTGVSTQAGTLTGSNANGNVFGMKLAKDGRLYIAGYPTNNALYYFPDANNPTSSTATPASIATGRSVCYQLPNNVYWGCLTCQSGTAAPALANTTITSNPTTVGDLITLLSASNKPAGTVITIHSAIPATDANKLANSTVIVAGTTYYAAFYDGLAVCYSPTTAVIVSITYCYKPAVLDAGNVYNSKHGITSLGRAGTDNENWPMVRQSAWSVLESKTKGLVVNRVRFNASNQPVADDGTTLVITNPVEGMMVYDKTNNCLKMYTSNNGGSTFQWHCMTTQACPN